MRIVAFLAALALVGCSRNDRTASQEPVSTTTVTLAPITIAGPSDDEELDRRANAASVAHVAGTMETFDDLTGHPFSLPEGDDRTQFHIQMALLQDADFVAHASDIDVQVDKGVVTLRGVATTPRARAAAERIASHQSGVVEVDNRLRIGPALPPSGHRSE